MYDDGTNGDAVAGDGLYSAILSYSENGIHTVQVDINNNALNAQFTTDAFQPAHPVATEEGNTPPPPILPWLKSSFLIMIDQCEGLMFLLDAACV